MPVLRHQLDPATETWLRDRLKTYGKRLQYWRRKRHWSVLDLSRATGVGVGTLRLMEQGDPRTTLATILLVASALKVELTCLVEDYLPALDFLL